MKSKESGWIPQGACEEFPETFHAGLGAEHFHSFLMQAHSVPTLKNLTRHIRTSHEEQLKQYSTISYNIIFIRCVRIEIKENYEGQSETCKHEEIALSSSVGKRLSSTWKRRLATSSEHPISKTSQ